MAATVLNRIPATRTGAAAGARAEVPELKDLMRTALQRHRCGPVWAQRLAVLAALTTLTACGTYGDFQEVSPSASRVDMHDWLSLDAIAGKPTWPSDFPLTEDERAMRDLAYPLIEWPYNRHKFYSVAGEYGVIGADHRYVMVVQSLQTSDDATARQTITQAVKTIFPSGKI